jgi:hypothetical protein
MRGDFYDFALFGAMVSLVSLAMTGTANSSIAIVNLALLIQPVLSCETEAINCWGYRPTSL